MKRLVGAIAAVFAAQVTVAGYAQTSSQPVATADAAPIDEAAHPVGVTVRKGGGAGLWADAKGRTLYALNMRIARARTGATLDYCTGPCLDRWKPFAAPANAAPAGRWQAVEAAQGWQWTYRGNLVFTFRDDKAAGATGGDGYDDLWSALHFVPPVPKIAGPAEAVPRFADTRYVLTDAAGRALFTRREPGQCATDCAGWQPFLAGMAARPVGDWTIVQGDAQSQWAFRGRPVFISHEADPIGVPGGGTALRL